MEPEKKCLIKKNKSKLNLNSWTKVNIVSKSTLSDKINVVNIIMELYKRYEEFDNIILDSIEINKINNKKHKHRINLRKNADKYPNDKYPIKYSQIYVENSLQNLISNFFNENRNTKIFVISLYIFSFTKTWTSFYYWNSDSKNMYHTELDFILLDIDDRITKLVNNNYGVNIIHNILSIKKYYKKNKKINYNNLKHNYLSSALVKFTSNKFFLNENLFKTSLDKYEWRDTKVKDLNHGKCLENLINNLDNKKKYFFYTDMTNSIKFGDKNKILNSNVSSENFLKFYDYKKNSIKKLEKQIIKSFCDCIEKQENLTTIYTVIENE